MTTLLSDLAESPSYDGLRVGVDLLSWERLQKAAERRGAPFLDRVFLPGELDACRTAAGSLRWPSLAARFAAKEAVAKALGTGLLGKGGVSFTDIEVVREEGGAPGICLYGRAARCFAELGGREIRLSLSHDVGLAIAFCVIRLAVQDQAPDHDGETVADETVQGRI